MVRAKIWNVNKNLPCPYCSHMIDKHDYDCENCKELLEGEDHFRKLVRDYSSTISWLDKFTHELDPTISSTEDMKNLIKEIKSHKLFVIKRIKDSLAKEGFEFIKDTELRNTLKILRDTNPSENDPDWDNFVYDIDSEEATDELFGEIDPPEYHKRERAIGTILVGEKEPPNVLGEFIIEMRECYKFGLFNATVIFCRSLLEIALSDYLLSFSGLKEAENISFINQNNLFDILKDEKIKRMLRKELIDKAHAIRIKANFSLHTKNKYIETSEKEALSVVKGTFLILEEIYK